MATVLIATIGSLGDMHPKIALGLELRQRGHEVRFAAMEFYREKLELLGFDFRPMAPHLNPYDTEFARDLMDERQGSERIIREVIFPSLPDMYRDMVAAAEGSEAFITGELIYAADAVAANTSSKWISTSLAPISFFSIYDPPVPPVATWLRHLRPLGATFHSALFALARMSVASWFGPYKQFRRGLGLSEDHDPVFRDKFSPHLHLAMFSRTIGPPQPDWPPHTVQSGFCFYDGQEDTGQMPDGLQEFLEAGEPPIVFTLGSAAVMDARDFYEVSAAAAAKLNKRAVLIYGVFNQPPVGITDDIKAFDYVPFSRIFPLAACVVHQGGVGTTGQVLRAGVPHLIVPFAHDQPDNAARCVRLGVGQTIARFDYNVDTAFNSLAKILSAPSYKNRASEAATIVDQESGTSAACDAIERILLK